MLIVAKGKVVVGRKIIGLGGELDGLTPEAEEQLIAAGVAKRVGAPVASEAAASGEDVRSVPGSVKEPSKAELQARCRELGVSARGSKAEMQARIDEAESADKEPEEAIEAGEADDDAPPELTAEVPR